MQQVCVKKEQIAWLHLTCDELQISHEQRHTLPVCTRLVIALANGAMLQPPRFVRPSHNLKASICSVGRLDSNQATGKVAA
jgi:hypothetical protein